MKPPYDAPYWTDLTDRERVNDLVHKLAQQRGMPYPEAYAIASRLIDAPGPGTYAVRLARANKLKTAIKRLIAKHKCMP